MGTGSSPVERGRGPHRFRHRLRAAFVLVAATSAAVLAIVTYAVTSNYRWRHFQESADDEVRVALALAPTDLDRSSFERLLRAYEKRSGTDVVAIGDDGVVLTSSQAVRAGDVPDEALAGSGDELVMTEGHRDGTEFLVVGGEGPEGSRYAFFFSLEQLESSLGELRVVLAVTWVGVVLVAAAAGELIARRTLRPVREAGEAATALASGLLDTRLPSAREDEFGAWAVSFNTMADALGTTIAELRDAAERERRFTADVAHDLRTPITGLALRASLLSDREAELPPDVAASISALAGDIDRLKDLVLDLLELTRLDGQCEGSTDLDRRPLAVARSIAESVTSLQLPDHVRIDVSVEPHLAARASPVSFRRIIANLVANAVAHGHPPLEVSAHHDGVEVVIDVCDRGAGIAAHDRERVFHRFAKTDESRTSGGSGLGLAIAREHARAQGGDIVASGRPGGGTRFSVTLPAATPRRSERRRSDHQGDDEVEPHPTADEGHRESTRELAAAPGRTGDREQA